jgi:hypothetical protein
MFSSGLQGVWGVPGKWLKYNFRHWNHFFYLIFDKKINFLFKIETLWTKFTFFHK